MKIGPTPSDGLRADGGKPAGTERPSAVRPGSGPDPVSSPADVERVSLSAGRETAIGGSTALPFDDRKVAEVRQMIAEGRFPVDAKRVAEQLLADSRDLLGLQAPAR